jgi:SNF2-related domain/Helicase conserved C-terminal domain
MHTLDRTKASFPAKLKQTLTRALQTRESKYAFLKYYQDTVRMYFELEVGARGVLIDHEMGLGKSILAVALMMDACAPNGGGPSRQPICVLPKSLAANMRRSIHKYTRMRAEVEPDWPIGMMNPTSLDAWIDEHISFVSMNAGNMLKQIDRATSDDSLEQQLEEVLKLNLDGKLLIVDEAHNLFRAITNGSKNGKGLYDLIMRSKNLRICFCTGTMIANDPFELVSCFNMLGGMQPILPEDYMEFRKLYVWDGRMEENGVAQPRGTIRNKEYFQNRIFGLVSSMQHSLLRENSVEFPERLPTEVVRVPMSGAQWISYSLARDKEREEGKKPGGRVDPIRMQKPKSRATSTYRVKSRQLSNYDPLEGESNKHRAIYDRIRARSGKLGLVYSQFIGEGGMKAFREMLEKQGWSELVYARSHTHNKSNKESKQNSITDAVMRADVADVDASDEDMNVDEIKGGVDVDINCGSSVGAHEYMSPWDYVNALHHADENKRGGDASVGPKYAIIAGDVDIADRERVQEIFNDPSNAHGDVVALLLISSTGAEGLDLKRLRHIHIMEPYWNSGRHEQIIARGVRAGSHVDLPPEEKNVESFIYLSVEPVDYDFEHAKVKETTTDVELYEDAVENQISVMSFVNAVREVSIECALNECKDGDGGTGACKRNCRMCAATSDQLFTFDALGDLKRPNPCRPAVVQDVEVQEIEHEGVRYYTAPDDASPFGVAWFKHDDTIDAYVPISENDPLFGQLMAIGDANGDAAPVEESE